jgi:hypothetical protein
MPFFSFFFFFRVFVTRDATGDIDMINLFFYSTNPYHARAADAKAQAVRSRH